MTSSTIEHLDLTKLPVTEKTKLCAILDQNESWMQLAKLMMFPEFEIFVSMTKHSINSLIDKNLKTSRT